MAKQAIPGASRGTVFLVDADLPVIIGLDTAHKEGEHPLYDERIKLPLQEGFVRNIQRYGNKEAVKIRKNGDVFEVIDGRQRTRAVREAKKRAEAAGEIVPRLKVELERGSEEDQVGIMISLNELRSANSPLVKAHKACRLLASGYSENDVALMFNVSVQNIRLWRKLEELAPAVKSAIDKEQIAAHAAIKLHELSHTEQTVKLTELLAEGGSKPSAHQVRGKVATANGEEAAPRLNKRIVKKLVADEPWIEGLSPDAAAILRFLAGEEKALKKVPGLMSRLKKFSQPKENTA